MYRAFILFTFLLCCIAPAWAQPTPDPGRVDDSWHCSRQEFLAFDARVEVWMLESEARSFNTSASGYEVYKAFTLADETLWEGGADMSALPLMCAEIAPVYLAMERVSRALIFHYILGLNDLLPSYNQMSAQEWSWMRSAVRKELENSIDQFFEALEAGYATFGLEWWGS